MNLSALVYFSLARLQKHDFEAFSIHITQLLKVPSIVKPSRPLIFRV